MSINRYLLASTAVGLVAIPHSAAAQNAIVTKAPPALPQAYSWAGPYLGLTVGGAWSDLASGCSFTASTSQTPCFPAGAPNLKPNGPLAGVAAGYNLQAGHWLLGLESDFNLLDVSDVEHFPAADVNYANEQLSTRYDWLGTVRGRAGFATDRVLFYGTGGFAYGRVGQQYSDASSHFASTSGVKTGWTAGGGVEYALDQHWSVKAEYLYVHFDSSTLSVPSVATTFNLPNRLNIVRAGVDFRF